MFKKGWGVLLVSIMLGLSACSTNQQETQPEKSVTTVADKKETKQESLPKPDHIVVVVEENHSKNQITNNPSASYINALMKAGATFTNYYGIDRPSQPNYLDMFSGANQGVKDNEKPPAKFQADNLGSELIEKNYSFAGYSEALPSVGYDGKFAEPKYARKHVPWTNFSNIPKEANQPLENFPKNFDDLPTVSFVIPNLQNDMHDGTIKEADQWLKKQMDSYVQWAKKHNSLLIVTWDEDQGSEANKIPTIFVGPMVKPGKYNEKYNHFNLLRTIEDIYGLSHAGKAETSDPILKVWK